MHRVLGDPRVASYEARFGRERVKDAAHEVLGRVRLSNGEHGFEAVLDAVVRKLERLVLATPKAVVNATGIILHTNLGRAPLAPDASQAVADLAGRYSNLEYDLESGERGSRYSAIGELLAGLTGAQDALVVNNCAAAVLLVLDTLAKNREVIVSRNQLVEIGGGFRVPEVLAHGGATLVEVGTTNRVYIEDFQRALSSRTALILRTHPSNYRMEGFTCEPSGQEMTALGRRAGVPVVEDLGSGALVDLSEYGVQRERTVQDSLADGIDLVTFSGDKLLGGPQAGIIVGRTALLARLRGNPLLRALRVGKLTLSALSATLECYLHGRQRERLPIYRMLSAKLEELRARAASYVSAVPNASLVPTDGYVGGGALPQAAVRSVGIAVVTPRPEVLAAHLRRGDPPIVGRIDGDRVVLDLRTIAPADDESVIARLTEQA